MDRNAPALYVDANDTKDFTRYAKTPPSDSPSSDSYHALLSPQSKIDRYDSANGDTSDLDRYLQESAAAVSGDDGDISLMAMQFNAHSLKLIQIDENENAQFTDNHSSNRAGIGNELHRPLFAPFESNNPWKRSSALTPNSLQFLEQPPTSPSTHQRQLPLPLSTSSSSSSTSPFSYAAFPSTSDSPAPKDLQLPDLQRVLSAMSGHHEIQLMTGTMLGQLYRDLLKNEGCLFCLGQNDLADDFHSSSQSQRYAVCQCNVSECKHIAHLACLIKAYQNAAAQSGSALEQSLLASSNHQSPLMIDSFHCTSQCRVLTVNVSDDAMNNHYQNGTRSFSVEFGFAHTASNARQSFVSWPSVVTRLDLYAQCESIHWKHYANDSDSPSNANPISPSNDTSKTSTKELLKFSLVKGKFLFRAIDNQTQETFECVMGYDLTLHGNNNSSQWKFIYIDGSKPTQPLIVGIGRSKDARSFVVHSIHYQLAPHTSALKASSFPSLSSPISASYGVINMEGDAQSSQVLSANSALPSQSPTSSSFNPAAREFVPSFASMNDSAQHSHQSVGHRGGFPNPTEVDEFGNPTALHGSHSNTNSPFIKSRQLNHFASAPVSHAASPLPSSRSVHYNHINGSTLLNPNINSSAAPALNPFSESQRLFKQASMNAMGGMGAGVPVTQGQANKLSVPLSSARASPQSFTRPLNSQTGRGMGSMNYFGGNTNNDWDNDGSGAIIDASNDDDSANLGNSNNFTYDEDDNFNEFHRSQEMFVVSPNSLSRRMDGGEPNEQSPLFLPALPTFPVTAPPGMNQINLGPNPLMNLTVDFLRGNVMRIVKSHAGSRFIQQKLDSGDQSFFSLFYDEMKDHVPELMVDNFSHFAIEKLVAACSDEQCLMLLQRLAPAIAMVACQKHGSFSVQALVDTLHTPAQIFTLVESMKADIVRILTHASGHFVVLRMLQRFPYQSTKFIDEAVVNNVGIVATDHHGLRVVKALLCIRRPMELTRLFKQVARLTMKLVENQYGNYCQEEHTSLALARGGTALAKDIRVGDQLAGQDGAVVTVLRTENLAVNELFRITTEAGSYDVTGNHLVTLRWAKSPSISLFCPGAKGFCTRKAGAGDILTLRAAWYTADGNQHCKQWRVLLTAPADIDEEMDVEDEATANRDNDEETVSSDEDDETNHRLHEVSTSRSSSSNSSCEPSPASRMQERDPGTKALVIDAQGTRQELISVAQSFLDSLPADELMAHGTLFELPASELHDMYWNRWQLGKGECLACATGALTVLRAPLGLSSAAATWPVTTVLEEAHLAQFASAVQSAKRAEAPIQQVLERIAFRVLADGTYAPLAVDQRYASMVYQLHNPLVGEDGTQTLNTSEKTAYTYLQLDALHAPLGINTAQTELVFTEFNPVASDTGTMFSVQTAYDAVCTDSMFAVLQLNAAVIVAFGWHTGHRWRDAVSNSKLGLSDGTEHRYSVHSKSGNYIITVLRAIHSASGQNLRQVAIYLAPHPSCWRDRGQLAATLAAAHGVPGEVIAARIDSCPALTKPDALLKIERITGPARVVDLEVDGNHRYAFATGQLTHNCVQSVLDVAPPGVRTNIKVKMEGKYMRLSKQKFSSNVVEKCLKQSSSHWRTIIIRELTAQPAVAELLRDRYGNYVLQTALTVANAGQVQEIMRAITPYLPSLRDNVRAKWKKMLKKAGTAVARGQNGGGDDLDDDPESLSEEVPEPDSPLMGTQQHNSLLDPTSSQLSPAAGNTGSLSQFMSPEGPLSPSSQFAYHSLQSPHSQQATLHNFNSMSQQSFNAMLNGGNQSLNSFLHSNLSTLSNMNAYHASLGSPSVYSAVGASAPPLGPGALFASQDLPRMF